MEIIIFIIIIISIIVKNNAKKTSNKTTNNANNNGSNYSNNYQRTQYVSNQSRRPSVPNEPRRQSVPNQPRREVAPNRPNSGKSSVQLKEEIWARLSEESKAKIKSRSEYQQMTLSDLQRNSSEETLSATQQIHKRRMEERNTSIIERAKGNNSVNEADVTLTTMEAEHQHSERVAPAIHNHPEENLQESMLGSVEDLIVKGYDGNLCFERDFLAEAMDMISHFTVPSEIPDYSAMGRKEIIQ